MGMSWVYSEIEDLTDGFLHRIDVAIIVAVQAIVQVQCRPAKGSSACGRKEEMTDIFLVAQPIRIPSTGCVMKGV